jgi:hypothetical protein
MPVTGSARQIGDYSEFPTSEIARNLLSFRPATPMDW